MCLTLKPFLLYGYKLKSGLLLFSLISIIVVFAQPSSQTFNSSGTYTVPAGYTANVTIEAWGAGGGGGSNSSGAKGGGGGGAYASSTTNLTAGSYTVTVGTGGGAGTAGGNSGFTTIVVAVGGQSTTGTTGGSGGNSSSCTGTTRVSGSNGSNTSGNNGGAGGAGGNGGGAGGAGGIANNGSGSSGSAPGGGGGGKAGPGNASVSGSGANGRVIVTVNIVVPVLFGNIQISEMNNAAQLEWVAYFEQNVKKYIIEKSADGYSFFAIGEVDAKNYLTETKYRFFDSGLSSGLYYYRIRAIDIDERYIYSNILRFSRLDTKSELAVYPNPVVNQTLFIQSGKLQRGTINLTVYNSSGQRIMNKKIFHSGGALTWLLHLNAELKSGLYYVSIQSETGLTKSASFQIVR